MCVAPHIITVIKLQSQIEWGFRVLQVGAETKFQVKNPLRELTLTLDDTNIQPRKVQYE